MANLRIFFSDLKSGKCSSVVEARLLRFWGAKNIKRDGELMSVDMLMVVLNVEEPKTPEEMIAILQRVVEDSSPVLVTAMVEEEERRTNLHLREEQDAAYMAALEANQARERKRQEEEEPLDREAAEAERKRKEEEARERAEREAAEREAGRVRMRQEKALALGDKPEKGPDVTQ